MTMTNWLTIIALALSAICAILAGQHQLIQRLIVAKYDADRATDRNEFKAAIDEIRGQLGQLLQSATAQGARLGEQERKHSRLVGFLEGKGLLTGMSGNEEAGN